MYSSKSSKKIKQKGGYHKRFDGCLPRTEAEV